MSWTMMVEFTPALIACVVSPADYSYRALISTKECVVAIPAVDIIKTVIDVGNCSGKDIDKFNRFKLTTLPAAKVSAPLIKECIYNVECKVTDVSWADKYAIFMLEAVKAWADPKRRERRMFHANGDGTFVVDGKMINMKKRMVKFKELL